MRVRSRRDADVAVPHEPLHTVHVHALAQQLRRERLAQVMEAHVERQPLRSEQPVTRSALPACESVSTLHDRSGRDETDGFSLALAVKLPAAYAWTYFEHALFLHCLRK